MAAQSVVLEIRGLETLSWSIGVQSVELNQVHHICLPLNQVGETTPLLLFKLRGPHLAINDQDHASPLVMKTTVLQQNKTVPARKFRRIVCVV